MYTKVLFLKEAHFSALFVHKFSPLAFVRTVSASKRTFNVVFMLIMGFLKRINGHNNVLNAYILSPIKRLITGGK